MTELLKLSNVFKWAGDGENRIEILRGVSLTIRAGEYTAIMGSSGSGKTTLLNLIGLLDSPSSGTIHFLGRDVSQLQDDELARERSHSIGFIFQTFNLLSYLTAQQNIEVPLTYSGRPQAPEYSRRLLAQVNLEHRATAYPPTLSGGERQRVAIARALANQPPLLLADEPTGALDSTTGTQIMDLIGRLHQAGSTIILITHDETIARRAQRILHLKDGRFTP